MQHSKCKNAVDFSSYPMHVDFRLPSRCVGRAMNGVSKGWNDSEISKRA